MQSIILLNDTSIRKLAFPESTIARKHWAVFNNSIGSNIDITILNMYVHKRCRVMWLSWDQKLFSLRKRDISIKFKEVMCSVSPVQKMGCTVNRLEFMICLLFPGFCPPSQVCIAWKGMGDGLGWSFYQSCWCRVWLESPVASKGLSIKLSNQLPKHGAEGKKRLSNAISNWTDSNRAWLLYEADC